MHNADDNYDPRGGRHWPNPAGRRRSHRPGCRNHARPGPLPDTASRRFSLPPSAFRQLPAVPNDAGLVAALLNAAQEHFAAASYAAADAFLKLIPQPVIHPAATWQQMGHLHFSLAEYEAAGRAYGYAAAYDPRDASLQVRLAHTCLLLEDIASFEGYLQRALTLDPAGAPAHQLLADLNRDHGRYPDAARFYLELIVTQPAHYENLLSLALCHSYLGEYEAAMNWLLRASQVARGTLSRVMS